MKYAGRWDDNLYSDALRLLEFDSQGLLLPRLYDDLVLADRWWEDLPVAENATSDYTSAIGFDKDAVDFPLTPDMVAAAMTAMMKAGIETNIRDVFQRQLSEMRNLQRMQTDQKAHQHRINLARVKETLDRELDEAKKEQLEAREKLVALREELAGTPSAAVGKQPN
ncbi:hypothetical protein EUX98_g1707 [Antrodiella citrinella]|uniref:Uncharacterized protein n=1 Tax=Antrodiella citrinella TaxID=2447956 RepID=A0A4S4N3S0_9APHY|nr:hypothetical protein EUX98_g1707 [Antrodiella citrinella]